MLGGLTRRCLWIGLEAGRCTGVVGLAREGVVKSAMRGGSGCEKVGGDGGKILGVEEIAGC